MGETVRKMVSAPIFFLLLLLFFEVIQAKSKAKFL